MIHREDAIVLGTFWVGKTTGRRSADIRGRIQTDGKKLMNENKRCGGGVFVTEKPRKDARNKATERISRINYGCISVPKRLYLAINETLKTC